MKKLLIFALSLISGTVLSIEKLTFQNNSDQKIMISVLNKASWQLNTGVWFEGFTLKPGESETLTNINLKDFDFSFPGYSSTIIRKGVESKLTKLKNGIDDKNVKQATFIFSGTGEIEDVELSTLTFTQDNDTQYKETFLKY